jgi:cytochrome bd-type quinol oxidase subunit 2
MKRVIVGLFAVLVLALGFGAVFADSASALPASDPLCQDLKGTPDYEAAGCGTEADDTVNSRVTTLINATTFTAGIVCVVFVVYGGVKFTSSEGEPAKVEEAKKLIMYAIIGLVVVVLAFAIVNFLLVGMGETVGSRS